MNRRLPPLVAERDRFGAAALQVERLTAYLRRRRDRHPEAAEAGWDHWFVSNGAVISEATTTR